MRHCIKVGGVPFTADRIDPDRNRAAEARFDGGDGGCARLDLAIGRDRILEIEHDHVRI